MDLPHSKQNLCLLGSSLLSQSGHDMDALSPKQAEANQN
jgi:hypothetical protein